MTMDVLTIVDLAHSLVGLATGLIKLAREVVSTRASSRKKKGRHFRSDLTH